MVATPTDGRINREKLLLFLCQICWDHLTVRLGLQASGGAENIPYFL